MSRIKSRSSVDVCADCGSPEPTWASVNRGILLCVQCCSIHRRLGSHISMVRSLTKSHWTQSQLKMVYALNNGGANKIWEHTLYENTSKSSRKKPGPKDSLEIKTDFINSKHKLCSFVFRANNEDGLLCVENELGKELHSSVRSNTLECSFRFLIQGADPNYFHDEKGSTPLHVAVKSNQLLQVELLLVYGADPSYPDSNGRTPLEYAKQCINKDILKRLVESQYELTDKFTQYLYHQKPDHENNEHFTVPQVGVSANPAATEKLRKLPNNLFEELAKDVYDEVDRREIETIWLSSADCIELSAIPFLPVNAELSSIRNQSRQKIARFSSPELKALVCDILRDAHRRQLSSNNKVGDFSRHQISHTASDDDPLYDSVASDDDYADVSSEPPNDSPHDNIVLRKATSLTPPPPRDQNQNSLVSSTVTPMMTTAGVGNTTGNTVGRNVQHLSQQLKESDTAIVTLRAEVTGLKALVEQLSSENFELKTRLSQNVTTLGNVVNNNGGVGQQQLQLQQQQQQQRVQVNGDSGSQSLDGILFTNIDRSKLLNGNNAENNNIDEDLKQRKNRPTSMYETREYNRVPNWQAIKNQMKQNDLNRGTTQSLYNTSQTINVQLFQSVTIFLTEFWQCVQSDNRENCTQYSEKIRLSITKFVDGIPFTKNGSDEIVKHLLGSVKDLHVNCIYLQEASKCGITKNVETYMQKVREYAYDIAQDMKKLYTMYATQG